MPNSGGRFTSPIHVGGVPIVAGSQPFGWKSNSASWFVDWADGSSSNNGTTPDQAFKYISEAITAADSFDVIYIMASGYTPTDDPTPYRETATNGNLIIPYAMDNISIIGVGGLGFSGKPVAPQIKGASGATTPVLKIQAPYFNIENLAFNRGSSTEGGIKGKNEGNQVDECMGLNVYNCYFRNLRGTDGNPATGAAIHITGMWQAHVNHCFFHNCRTGVTLMSGTRTLTEALVTDSIFGASAASNISADIYIYTQGTNDTSIYNCKFNHALPSYSGGSLYYIHSVGNETGLIDGCTTGGVTVYTSGAAGTGFRCGTGMNFGQNYTDSALMAAAE